MARISLSKVITTGATSGNANGVTAGNAVSGAAVFMPDLVPSTLSAKFVVLAETNTLTFTARWQGSDDGTTWENIANAPQNPAGVALATGTAGADSAVTVNIPSPVGASGFRFIRAQAVVGVATGASADTYAISYRYVRL
jgi:hypothetical protein